MCVWVCVRAFLWDRVCVCVCVCLCVCVSIESMCSWLRALVKAMSAQEAWTVSVFVFGLVFIFSAKSHNTSFHSNTNHHNQPTRHCQPQLPHQLYHHTQHTNTNLRFHALPIQESKQNAHKTHKPMPHNPKPSNPYSPPATARVRVCAFVCVFLWDLVCVCICVYMCICVCV